MATNTIKHVSDESKYKIFNPAGTSFPANIINVQDALAALKPIALNGVPNATETTIGISRFGTQAEIDAGVLTNVGVSPKTLKSAITRPPATTTVAGLTRYATDAETKAFSVNNAAVVPTSLKIAIDDAKNAVLTTQATETRMGVAKISTEAAAVAGQDDTTMMTPKKTIKAIVSITSKLPSPEIATYTVRGMVQIAPPDQVIDTNKNFGWAVSPAGLYQLRATTTKPGLVILATGAEVSAGSDNTKPITSAGLLNRIGGANRLGLLKTTTKVNQGDASTVLAYNADVMHTRGGQTIGGTLTVSGAVGLHNGLSVNNGASFNGAVNISGSGTLNGSPIVTANMITDDVPIGAIVMWVGAAGKVPTKWRIADGQYTSNAASFLNVFPDGRVPDMRGLFVRGVGASQEMVDHRVDDNKGKRGLGYGCGGENEPGKTQTQQVRRHKHNSGWGEHHNRSDAYFGCTDQGGLRGNNRRDNDNYLYFTNEGEEWGAEATRTPFGTMNTKDLMGYENRPWNMSVYYIVKVM